MRSNDRRATHAYQPAGRRPPRAEVSGASRVSRWPQPAYEPHAPLKLSSNVAHEEAVVSTGTRADADGRLRNLAAAFDRQRRLCFK